jgi:phosphoribosylformylglycinamidine synthase
MELAFVSGNVSLYNQSAAGTAIPASPIIACVGALDDISRSATPGLKRAGSILLYVGRPQKRFAGSVAAEVLGVAARELPAPDYPRERADVAFVLAALRRGLALSVHDVSDGGVLTAVCEMAFAARPERALGVELDWSDPGLLFGEFGGFVVEAELTHVAALDALYEESYGEEAAWEAATLGRVVEGDVLLAAGRHFDLARLHEAWAAPLRDFYDAVPQ